ncbi:hypothetical protein EDD86DRAFT_203430 [Gorgonomyces haynaldii]|nr:hypothetical protein EDD86DRAFT_203430 [Gorgonomyces haynaldii]
MKYAGEIIFSSAWSRNPSDVLQSDNKLLFPLKLYLDLSRKRPSRSRFSKLTLTSHVSLPLKQSHLCDPEDFDAVDPLRLLKESLDFDQSPALLIPTAQKKQPTTTESEFKSSTSTVLKIGPLLHAFVQCSSLNMDNTLVTLTLCSGDFLEQVDLMPVQMHMAQAVVTPLANAPTINTINHNDRVCFLFNLLTVREKRSLEHFPSVWSQSGFDKSGSILNLAMQTDAQVPQQRTLFVTIQAKPKIPGTDGQTMTLRFYTHVTFSPNGSIQNKELTMNYGRRFEESVTVHNERIVQFQGLSLSVNVASNIRLRHVFNVQVLLINTGTKTKKLQLKVQTNQTQELGFPQDSDSYHLHMPFEQFIGQYESQLDRSQALVCLEQHVDIEPIPPQSCRLLLLHFIAIKGSHHTLPPLVLTDLETKTETVYKDLLQIFIQ